MTWTYAAEKVTTEKLLCSTNVSRMPSHHKTTKHRNRRLICTHLRYRKLPPRLNWTVLTAWPLKMGATGSPETSVWNHVTPPNNPEYGSRSYPLLCAMYITFLFIIYILCYYMYIIIHLTYLLYMSHYILFVLHLLFLKDQDILEHYPFHICLVSRTAISFHVFRITLYAPHTRKLKCHSNSWSNKGQTRCTSRPVWQCVFKYTDRNKLRRLFSCKRKLASFTVYESDLVRS